MALSGLIATDADGTLVAFGSPTVVAETTEAVFDVTHAPYSATGDGATDDSDAIQSAVDAAVAIGSPALIWFPRGTYLVQDSSTGTHTTSADGVIRIPPGASKIRLRGDEATLLLGSNGAGTSVIRIFGAECDVDGLIINLNGTVPLNTKANVGIQINGSHADATANVDGCDCRVERCHIYGSRYRDEYSTGTVAYDHTGNGSGERVVILTGGTWPSTAATNGVVKFPYDAGDPSVGEWYDVSARISDTVLQLTSGSNPGGDVASGTAYMFHGEPYKHQGRDGIQIIQGYRNYVQFNRLTDIGWTALRAAGGDNFINFNVVQDQRGNGIRLLENTNVTCEGNVIESAYNSGRHCIIADAGSSADSSPLTNNDVRTNRMILRNNTCRTTTDGDFEGACSVLKIAAVRDCLVDGGEYSAGTQTNNVAVRIEDSVKHCQFTHGVRVIGSFLQTPSIFSGAVSAETSRASGAYAGKSQLTVASHALVEGKSLFLTNSSIAAFDNREFIVIEVVDSNNVVIGYVSDADGTVTPMPYNGGSITNTQADAGVYDLLIHHCVFERGQHEINYFLEGLHAPYLDIEGNRFEMTEAKAALVKESCLLTSYGSDLGMQQFRFVRNQVLFNSDKLCRVIRGTNDNLNLSAATILLTAGRITCYDNVLDNKNTGTVALVNRFETNDSTSSYDDRLIIFSTDGERPNCFVGSGVNTENVVTWTAGQRIRNSNPGAGGVPAWVVTTGGTSPTFQKEAALAAL